MAFSFHKNNCLRHQPWRKFRHYVKQLLDVYVFRVSWIPEIGYSEDIHSICIHEGKTTNILKGTLSYIIKYFALPLFPIAIGGPLRIKCRSTLTLHVWDFAHVCIFFWDSGVDIIVTAAQTHQCYITIVSHCDLVAYRAMVSVQGYFNHIIVSMPIKQPWIIWANNWQFTQILQELWYDQKKAQQNRILSFGRTFPHLLSKVVNNDFRCR